MPQTWCALRILISKCALRRNGAQFFGILTSKISQKHHQSDVLCTIWLRHVLRAATACASYPTQHQHETTQHPHNTTRHHTTPRRATPPHTTPHHTTPPHHTTTPHLRRKGRGTKAGGHFVCLLIIAPCNCNLSYISNYPYIYMHTQIYIYIEIEIGGKVAQLRQILCAWSQLFPALVA